MDSSSQHCCRKRTEALLLHGEADPMIGLPARATSATSPVRAEGMRWVRLVAVSGQIRIHFDIVARDACGYCPQSENSTKLDAVAFALLYFREMKVVSPILWAVLVLVDEASAFADEA